VINKTPLEKYYCLGQAPLFNAIFKATAEHDTWQGRLFSRGQATNPRQTGFTCSQGAAL